MKPPYEISPANAAYLLALLDGKQVPARSNDDLLMLLRETLRLAASIAENCKGWLETAAMVHGDMHPYQAEKLNIPTLEGALSAAVVIPRVDCPGMCPTCAFRPGSIANQTEATALGVTMEWLLTGEASTPGATAPASPRQSKALRKALDEARSSLDRLEKHLDT